MSGPSGPGSSVPGSRGAVAQLVAHLHGMEGVRGSNPLSSTQVRGRFRSWDWPLLIFRQQQTAATASPTDDSRHPSSALRPAQMTSIDLPAAIWHGGGQGFESPQLHRGIAGQRYRLILWPSTWKPLWEPSCRLPAWPKLSVAATAKTASTSTTGATISVWRSVRARGDTKTVRSRRTLKLPEIAVEALRAQMVRAATRAPRRG